MKLPAPRFELAHVYDDGTRDAMIVPVTHLPLETRMNRRGFLGGGVVASAVLGALAASSSEAEPGSRLDGPGRVRTATAACGDARAHIGGVEALTIGPDGKTLASGGADGSIKLWRLPDGALIKTLDGHGNSVQALAFSPDGRTLASGSKDKTIKLWRLPEGTLLKTMESHRVDALAFSPDGKTLASGCWDTAVKLWRVPDGVLLKTLTGHSDAVYALAISPDGKILASGSSDQSIRLWRLPDGAFLNSLGGRNEWVHALVFSPDGRMLASGSEDNTVKLWRLPDGALLKTLEGHGDFVYALAMSPDGKMLASGSGDKTIKLWRLPDGALVKTLEGHRNFVYALAMSPDGKILASGGADQSIKLWRLPEGEFNSCPVDLIINSSGVKGLTYQGRNENGVLVTYTLPCGSPIPPGATCTCNCVPGSYRVSVRSRPVVAPVKPSGGSHQYCSCVPVCVCMAVPVCQAHRLLHEDPVVRTMAEELLLHMGRREFLYMTWAADKAEGALRTRIHEIMTSIDAGAKANPDCWPGVEACLARLAHPDEVVAIMAAQTLRMRQVEYGARLDAPVLERVHGLLRQASLRPWYTRERYRDGSGLPHGGS